MWDVIAKLSSAGVLACVAAIVTHEVRISVIEANRFTDEDALAMERRIMGAIPPPVVELQFASIAEDLQEIKLMLSGYDARLRALENK